MSDEVTERDVEALAKSVCPCRWGPHDPNESIECAWALDLTRAVLRSDLLAERIAQARREGAAELHQAVAKEFPGWNGTTDHFALILATLRGDA